MILFNSPEGSETGNVWNTMIADKFRRLALELPGASERQHMGHPDFRVEGKIFATLGYPDGNWGMVKLTPEQQQSFVTMAPGAFRPCKGSWGERGATNVCLEAAKVAVVRAALDAAWRNIAGERSSPQPDQTKKSGSRSVSLVSRKRLELF
jgi:hypothetical protein